MARWMKPTPKQLKGYQKWVKKRPPVVRKICERLNPWELYWLNGQRVIVHGVNEDGTVTVVVSAKFNFVFMERTVFGVDPDELTPCELPGPNDQVGIFATPEEALELIDARRKKNGVPPLTDDEKAEAMIGLRAAYEDRGAEAMRKLAGLK